MPPRHVYWTIIFGNQPTAFRAATREELLPTLKQLQSRHPDAVMMWFARGRLWQSEEEAREALIRRREEHRPRKPRFEDRAPRPGDAPAVKDRWRNRPPGAQGTSRGGDAARGRDWRPGGEHKDPRDRFKVPRDVKRARFKARRRWEPEAGGGKPEAGGWKPPAGGRKPGAGSRQPGAGSRKPEAGSRQPGAGSRKPGAGSWKPRPPGPPFKKPFKRPFKKKDEE
jgi:hypothetical protein